MPVHCETVCVCKSQAGDTGGWGSSAGLGALSIINRRIQEWTQKHKDSLRI